MTAHQCINAPFKTILFIFPKDVYSKINPSPHLFPHPSGQSTHRWGWGGQRAERARRLESRTSWERKAKSLLDSTNSTPNWTELRRMKEGREVGRRGRQSGRRERKRKTWGGEEAAGISIAQGRRREGWIYYWKSKINTVSICVCLYLIIYTIT